MLDSPQMICGFSATIHEFRPAILARSISTNASQTEKFMGRMSPDVFYPHNHSPVVLCGCHRSLTDPAACAFSLELSCGGGQSLASLVGDCNAATFNPSKLPRLSFPRHHSQKLFSPRISGSHLRPSRRPWLLWGWRLGTAFSCPQDWRRS
ncbi:hypothetical protein BKA80DRAFT_89975 [Phyllosticta citrichinensis]